MPEAEIQPDATAFDMPRHVAIIMDGNGRWAATRGLPRAEGHRRGVEALRRTVRAAGEMGIKILTIFSFSAENWSRPASEIGELMGCYAASSQRSRRTASEQHSRAGDRRACRAGS
jgi:undecaprenyl diphosphate synthase